MYHFGTFMQPFVTSARFRRQSNIGATGAARPGRVRLESVEECFQRIEYVWNRADAISPGCAALNSAHVRLSAWSAWQSAGNSRDPEVRINRHAVPDWLSVF